MSVGWLSLTSVRESADRKIQSAAWTEATEGKLQPAGRLKNRGQASDSGTRWAPAAPALKTSQMHSSSCEKLAVSLDFYLALATVLFLVVCVLFFLVLFFVKLGG